MFGKVEYAAIYSLCFIMAAGTLYYPSESVQGVIGGLLTVLYGALILIGAGGALWGVLRPNYRFEMVFLVPLSIGILTYDVALWTIFADRLTHPIDLVPAYAPPLIVGAFGIWLIMKLRYLWIMNRNLIRAADYGSN